MPRLRAALGAIPESHRRRWSTSCLVADVLRFGTRADVCDLVEEK